MEKKHERTTSYIKHLAVSWLSSVSARIKSGCNLTGKCFEMPNVSYTQTLCTMVKEFETSSKNIKMSNFAL